MGSTAQEPTGGLWQKRVAARPSQTCIAVIGTRTVKCLEVGKCMWLRARAKRVQRSQGLVQCLEVGKTVFAFYAALRLLETIVDPPSFIVRFASDSTPRFQVELLAR